MMPAASSVGIPLANAASFAVPGPLSGLMTARMVTLGCAFAPAAIVAQVGSVGYV
jgi:hypothetical protein